METTPTKLQQAQAAYMVAASRLLDEAEEVRRRRDELLKLMESQERQQEVQRA